MSFKIGEEVVCIAEEKWHDAVTKEIAIGPKKDDICTIVAIKTIEPYLGLGFIEYPGYLFDARYFRKLSDIQALQNYKLNTTILEDLSAPIKIGKGLPKPQELEKLQKL